MGKRRWNRPATRQEMRFALGRFELKDILTEDEILDLSSLAHSRIVGVFRRATERHNRRATHEEHQHDVAVGLDRPRFVDRVTDNYIRGVGGRCTDLAYHVTRKVENHFVTPKQLPNWTDELAYELQIKIAAQVERKLIQLELATLKQECDIWYDDGFGFWCIRQSVVDQHVLERKKRRQQLKDDRRNEHGQVRSQRIRRGRPAGVSVSWQPAC